MWLIVLYDFFFPSNLIYYMSPFDSLLQNWLMLNAFMFIFWGLKSTWNLKFHQMDSWFEFVDIQRNEKEIIFHDCHGFKWQNIIYLSNFDCFSLRSDALYDSLECDCTLSWTFVFWFDNYEHPKFIVLFFMFSIWILA